MSFPRRRESGSAEWDQDFRFRGNDTRDMHDPLFILCLTIAGCTAILSHLLSIASTRWAIRYGAVDQPTGGRKIHTQPIPLWGGVGVASAMALSSGLVIMNGLILGGSITGRQLIGFAAGAFLLVCGGVLDDRWSLPPFIQLLFPLLAALIVLLTGTGIHQITSLTGPGGASLAWWTLPSLHVILPADLITIAWLLFATYTTKLLDGLDGLVTGMAVIGSAMVGALTLSARYFQPDVALFTSSIGGAFLGFLPRNIHPAKQFLGEVGSTLAGFSLGFLAIVSGAKVAVALAVLAIPLADAACVLIGRIYRGVSPWKGDDTHLHFRLLRAGLPHRTVVLLLWGISFAAGVAALSLQTRGKIFLLASLIILTFLSSWLLQRVRR